MSDLPTDSAGPGEQPARTLSEILTELAQLSHTQQGEASEMRSAVSELSRSLARLFEMIRSDRQEQRARIGQLERELGALREQLRSLGVEPLTAPAPNDFDQLRAAAERLRVRTEQLVRASAEAGDAGDAGALHHAAAQSEPAAQAEAPEAQVPDPGALAGESADVTVEVDLTAEPEAPVALEVELPVLRVVAGGSADASEPASEAGAPPQQGFEQAEGADLDVESELPMDAAAVAAASSASAPKPAAAAPATPEPAATPEPPPARPEPIPVAPRAAVRRRARLRRRRFDARKLTGVEPAAALGAMVARVDQLWTAGCTVDLVIAFTDGGALRVAGGDHTALRVEEVEPGTPARCTITATRRQLLPLFGRLDLTDDESAPLIHGSRRDADLLAGWFDRAQRLPVQPL